MAYLFLRGVATAGMLILVSCTTIRRVDENHVRIRGQLFLLQPVADRVDGDRSFDDLLISAGNEVPAGFEFERMIVKEVRARGESLGAILKQALDEIGLDANRVVFFPASLGEIPVTAHLRNMTMADLIGFAGVLADAEIVRQTYWGGDPPRDQGMFILRARSMAADQISRAFVVHEGATTESVAAFVSRLAAVDPTIRHEFQRARGILILHGRRSVVELAERY